MVKLGFIAEGATEKIILEKSDFFTYLNSLNIQYIFEVVDATGNKNLLPNRLPQYSQILKDKGATAIIVLADLDTDQCITLTKERISAPIDHTVIISIKEVEAWFLADEEAMRILLNDVAYTCQNPEIVTVPYNEINTLHISRKGRGVNGKVVLANRMVGECKFSIMRAAKHPNCPSAKYFIDKIQLLATETT